MSDNPQGWSINVFTEQGKTLDEALALMPQHSDHDCKIAWGWWDDNCRRDMMEAIQGFAQTGMNTASIFEFVKPRFPAGFMTKVSPKGFEFLAMAIEHAVREAKR